MELALTLFLGFFSFSFGQFFVVVYLLVLIRRMNTTKSVARAIHLIGRSKLSRVVQIHFRALIFTYVWHFGRIKADKHYLVFL